MKAVLVAIVSALTARAESSQELLKVVDEIAAQVSSQRGLKIKQPIKKGVLPRQEIAQRLMQRVRREYAPEEIRAEERVLKRLGLLEESVDYEKAVTDLLMDQVAGFYDPFEKELFIADWLGMELQRPALAHEIVHALGDQHFDLRSYAKPLKEEGDRQLARAALAEGDGTAAMIEFVLAEQSAALGMPAVTDIGQIPDAFFSVSSGLMAAGGMPGLEQAPRYLRETLIFPYVEGLRFVVTARRRQPWSAVDAMYKRPPESTEQILHPEKYNAKERPVTVPEPAPASLGTWKRLRAETMGELQTRLWLETRLDATTARRAAEGWGGDRLVAYELPTAAKPMVVQRSTWDSQADAEEYARAVSRLFAQMTGQAEKGGQSVVYEQDNEIWSVETRGNAVAWLLGAPKDQRTPLIDALWKSWKPTKSRF